MKIELNLDGDLIKDLQEAADSRSCSLNDFISAALKADLLRSEVFLNEVYTARKKQNPARDSVFHCIYF